LSLESDYFVSTQNIRYINLIKKQKNQVVIYTISLIFKLKLNVFVITLAFFQFDKNKINNNNNNN